MIRSFAASLALLLSTSQIASAQSAGQAERLRDAALHDHVAWDITEGLTTEVGQRAAGTEAEARARTWAVAKLKELGFSNVHIEEYRMPVWVRGDEHAEIVSPYPQKLVLAALGYSGLTGPAGISAPVVGFNGLDSLRAASAGSLKGKIVFLNHAMEPTQDGSGYSYYGPVRFEGPAIAMSKGAAAVVIRSVGTDHHRVPHTGMTRVPKDGTPIPAAALSVPDAENLQRMLDLGKPVIMHLVLTPRLIGEQVSGNVVADVPGTDPSAGIVLIGGHLDSWDLGTGAIDDASGVAITAAAAKRIMDAPGRPRRTIRLVWWGSEETGGYGSDAFFERHKGDKVVAAAESDFGADRVWRFQSNIGNKAVRDRVAAALAPIGVVDAEGKPEGGADVEKWGDAGVPLIDLDQDGTHYFDLHHTADDTLDKIDRDQLSQNVAAWTAMLSVITDAPEDIGRSAAK